MPISDLEYKRQFQDNNNIWKSTVTSQPRLKSSGSNLRRQIKLKQFLNVQNETPVQQQLSNFKVPKFNNSKNSYRNNLVGSCQQNVQKERPVVLSGIKINLKRDQVRSSLQLRPQRKLEINVSSNVDVNNQMQQQTNYILDKQYSLIKTKDTQIPIRNIRSGFASARQLKVKPQSRRSKQSKSLCQ